MINKGQVEILKTIIEDNEELITDLAKANKISNPDVSVGVAHFLVADNSNFSKMSKSQKYHYDNAIEPLISKVRCSGMNMDYQSCVGNNYIDEADLIWAYRYQDMSCQECKTEKDRWYINNP